MAWRATAPAWLPEGVSACIIVDGLRSIPGKRAGVHGDATKGTAEKGEQIFEAAVEGLLELVDELRDWPIEKRSEMHEHPVQSSIRW